MKVNQVAVIGTGTMGGQIAAVFANANIPVFLYGHETHLAEAIPRIEQLKPNAFTTKNKAEWITPVSLENDLFHLASCDLVIEAIIEDFAAKTELFESILPFLKKSAIIASNTSSLNIAALANHLSTLSHRFLGIHFFNPPRYMSLVEVITTPNTDLDLLKDIEFFLTSELGKNMVFAKDQPGFIANRIGVFAMASAIVNAEKYQLDFDTVDALTGTLIHRPKSATFRTADLVGLDIMKNVFNEFSEKLINDPWKDYFKLPHWLEKLIENHALGNKTKKGIYQKNKNNLIEVYQPESDNYRVANYAIEADIKSIMKKPLEEALQSLQNHSHPQAKFLLNVLTETFNYASYHIENIGNSTRDIDNAMHWGFGWNKGIFEFFQPIAKAQRIEQYLNKTRPENHPAWLKENPIFYSDKGAWSPQQKCYLPQNNTPCYQRQLYRPVLDGEQQKTMGITLIENESARVWATEDNLLTFSLKSKMHTLNLQAVETLAEAIEIAEKDYKALIIWQAQAPFSAGANLYEIFAAAKLGQIESTNLFSTVKQKLWQTFQPNLPQVDHLPSIKEILEKFQNTLMRLKYAKVPTIAAVQGLAIGGGCELLLHCQRRVVAQESYIGLVEAGVGLLPAGGGIKEMVLKASQHKNRFDYLAQYFEQIGLAKVSSSADEAVDMGYLQQDDVIIQQPLELFYIAKQQANLMIENHFRSANPMQLFAIGGEKAMGNLLAQLTNLKQGHFISEHDYLIAEKIADVICGGALDANSKVNSEYLLELERTHFIELLKEEKTLARIEHMLKTHKPLRN